MPAPAACLVVPTLYRLAVTDDQAREALRLIFEEPDMTLCEHAARWRCEALRLWRQADCWVFDTLG